MKRHFILRTFYLFSGMVLAGASLTGCDSKDAVQAAGQPGAGGGRPPAPVVVANVEQRDIPSQISAIGNVEAYQMVQIRSQVNGQINDIFFKEGQDVHKGQLLFRLDKRPFQADLEKAQGAMQRDEAQAENSQAQANRYTELEKQGVISREQADLVRSQAKADASAVNADKAAVDAARVQLQYTDIAAPIDARTGALLINKGNLVKANDTPFLVQLNQITPIYVTFSVPEGSLEEIRRLSVGHLKVLVYPKGQTNPVEGDLTFIDNGVNPQTGTVKLKGTFQNKDRRLWPGEFADVVVNLSVHKNAIIVPTKAIQNGQQGDYVYVVTQQDTAEPRPVKVTGTYQDFTLVASGVTPGERVIVNGQLRVAPNAKVAVQSAQPGSASTNAGAASNPTSGVGQ
jgi:membrane fusion protein, multidrug efflux system